MHSINCQQMQQLRNQGWKVSIQYVSSEAESLPYSRATVCSISKDVGHGRLHSTGTAFCSRQDQFSKDIGSSLAFTRAISKLPLTRAERKALLSV